MITSMKIVGIAAATILVLMPTLTLAQTHAHPSRHMLIGATHRMPAQLDWMALAQPVPQPFALSTCHAASCRPMDMFGIGY